jgi:hypothetical protein
LSVVCVEVVGLRDLSRQGLGGVVVILILFLGIIILLVVLVSHLEDSRGPPNVCLGNGAVGSGGVGAVVETRLSARCRKVPETLDRKGNKHGN